MVPEILILQRWRFFFPKITPAAAFLLSYQRGEPATPRMGAWLVAEMVTLEIKSKTRREVV